MKKHTIFPAVILIGFGAYFFLEQANITPFPNFYSWPTLLFLVGIAFLFQGYLGRDYDAILPGGILTCLGIHFHLINLLEIWTHSPGIFILIIALAFLLRYQKTGEGLSFVIIFLIVAVLLLFYKRLSEWLGILENGAAYVLKFWPIIFVVYGIYLLIRRKK